jgi:hypothetical protein
MEPLQNHILGLQILFQQQMSIILSDSVVSSW